MPDMRGFGVFWLDREAPGASLTATRLKAPCMS
jgi:hypothetical protein